MATDRPDPAEFFDMAQRMLRDFFGEQRRERDDPWSEATRRQRAPSADRQRENLTFALGTRAVEALEDLALNVAAIRQRLERLDARPPASRPDDGPEADGGAAAGR